MAKNIFKGCREQAANRIRDLGYIRKLFKGS